MFTLLLLAASASPDAPMADHFAIALKQSSPAPVSVITHRAPIGHTHTCTACGTTWDHTANPTHTCATCGKQQTTVDVPSRAVTIRSVAAPAPAPAPAPTVTYSIGASTTYSLGGSACANGQCNIPQSRGGIFPLFRPK